MIIPRMQWDEINKNFIQDPNPSAPRLYVGGNNHHVEVLDHKGKWKFKLVSMFEAAERACQKRPIVNRAGSSDERFVMSLHLNEMLELWMGDDNATTKARRYMRVVKLDRIGKSIKLQLADHADARASKHDEPSKKRELIAFSPRQLQNAGYDDSPPVKVRVGPLGGAQAVEGD